MATISNDGGDVRDAAYVELVTDGFFGEAGAMLVTAVVAAVSGARRPAPSYPTGDGSWEWSDPDVAEATSEFVDHLATTGKLAALLLVATDGSTLEAGLYVRCVSWFQDRGRQTDAGAFHRKLVSALDKGRGLGEVDEVAAPDGSAWHLPGDPTDVYRGPDDVLLEGALAVDVKRLFYAKGKRRDPVTDWRGVLDISKAMMVEAAMAVLLRTLHRLGMRRLGIDTRGDVDRETAGDDEGFDAVLVEQCAAEVMATLDTGQWATLTAASVGGAATVMELRGVKESAAYNAIKAATAAINDVLAAIGLDEDVGFARSVVGRVLAVGRLHDGWTPAAGSTSDDPGGAP